MPSYDSQVNEHIGGDKSELFASIVRKARVQVDQEKVRLWNIAPLVYNIDYN